MIPTYSYEGCSNTQTPLKVPSSQGDKTPAAPEFGFKRWLDNDLLKLTPEPDPSILSELQYETPTHTHPGLGSDARTQGLHLYHPLPTLQQVSMKLQSTASTYPPDCKCESIYSQYDSQHSIRILSCAVQEPCRLPKLECLVQAPQSFSKLECLELPYFYEPPILPNHNGRRLPLALREPLTKYLEYIFPREVIHSKTSIDKGKSPLHRKRHQAGIHKRRYTKMMCDPKKKLLLNELFFATAGNDRQPTKAERRFIQKKTGITSRNLTYCLSNRKRRFKPELRAYKRLSLEGRIHSYSSFLKFCKHHIVPELKGKCMDRLGDKDNYSSCDDD